MISRRQRVNSEQNVSVLPRVVGISVRRLRTWRHTPALLRSPRARRRATTKVVTGISSVYSGARRCASARKLAGVRRGRARRCASAHKVAGVCRARARRATPGPSKLCHGDRLTGANRVERLRYGPSVRVVVTWIWVVAIGLVGIEVGKRGDGVRVWRGFGCRMGCGVRVSDRVSGCVESSIEAGPTRTVCWQGDASIVRVKFRPLYFLVCDLSVKSAKQKKSKHAVVIVVRRMGKTRNCYRNHPTASGKTSTQRSR
jgi:hypothetical protein